MLSPQDKLITQEETSTPHFWDDLYGRGISPWDTGKPDRFLQEAIAREGLSEGAEVLDIGCGTGTNAVWLAQQGFRVTGVDVSSVAIERARARASLARSSCNFLIADILTLQLTTPAFDFA